MTPRAEIIHLGGSGVRFDRRRTTLRTQAWMHYMRKRWSPPRALAGGVLLWTNAAMRYFIGRAFPWALGTQRAANLSNAYRDITLRPALWWNGYHSQTPRKPSERREETPNPPPRKDGADGQEPAVAEAQAFACAGQTEG